METVRQAAVLELVQQAAVRLEEIVRRQVRREETAGCLEGVHRKETGLVQYLEIIRQAGMVLELVRQAGIRQEEIVRSRVCQAEAAEDQGDILPGEVVLALALHLAGIRQAVVPGVI